MRALWLILIGVACLAVTVVLLWLGFRSLVGPYLAGALVGPAQYPGRFKFRLSSSDRRDAA